MDEFLAEYAVRVLQLTDIFKTLDKDTQRHKTALPGALKIKKAHKTLEALIEAAREPSETLLACQAIMREVVLGMLDLTFSMEDALVSQSFADSQAVEAVQSQLDDLVGWATRLSALFVESEVTPKEPAIATAESLGPEITEMLTNAAKNQRGNQKSSVAAPHKELAERKQRWAQSDGRLSKLLEPENKDQATTPDCDVLQQGFDAFQQMIRAQGGPVGADLEAPDQWKAAGQHEETAALLHHGIYSSTHLLALKQQCEIAYWLWKYHPTAERVAVGQRTLRQFVFVVEKLIPDRGWTAELEKKRAKEVERAARTLMPSAVDGAGGEAGDGGVSTMEVLEQEFGSMDVQQEIDQMKKEDGAKDVQKKTNDKKNDKRKSKKK